MGNNKKNIYCVFSEIKGCGEYGFFIFYLFVHFFTTSSSGLFFNTAGLSKCVVAVGIAGFFCMGKTKEYCGHIVYHCS